MPLKENKTAKANQVGKDNIAIQNSVITINNSSTIDEVTRLIKEGQIDKALETLDTLSRAVAGQHPLFPYYRTAITTNEEGRIRLKSVPTTQESLIKYPPRIHGKLSFPSKYKNFKSIDTLLEYSYKKQEDIEINVIELKKMLGDIIDPYQNFSDEELKKMSWKIKHKDFPPPQPMKLYFKDNSFSIDYLEIGLDRIDGDILYFNNKRQGYSIFFEFTFNVKHINESSFSYKINEAYKFKVSPNIQFLEIMKNIQMNKGFALRLLKEEQDIFEAKAYTLNSSSDLFDRQEYLFLKNLELIEKTFGVIFELENGATEEDINNTDIVIHGILGKALESDYSEFKSRFSVDDTLRLSFKEFRTHCQCFKFEFDNKSFRILNVTVPVKKLTYTLDKPKVFEYEKAMKKIEVLDNGDEIVITFIPSEDSGKLSIDCLI